MMVAFLRKTALLWLAIGMLAAGYILLSAGDITAAPLLLVVGYCILVPLFLWQSFRGFSGE